MQKAKKPEGIVTNLSSIRDYLNYFINFLYGRHLLIKNFNSKDKLKKNYRNR